MIVSRLLPLVVGASAVIATAAVAPWGGSTSPADPTFAEDVAPILYRNCASCHRDDLKGTPPTFPSLVDIGQRRTRDEIATMIRQGAGRMSGFAGTLDNSAINDLVTFLVTGKDAAERAAENPYWLKYPNDG